MRILRVLHSHPMMQLAAVVAADALDPKQKVGVVLTSVWEGERYVMALGCNGSPYHEEHGCERKRRGCASGVGYELCEGCHPRNHAEAKALRALAELSRTATEAWMWGHWYACAPCTKILEDAGVETLYLVDDAEKRFRPT